MQARQQQDEMGKVVEQQQQTAIILERVMGRLDAVERWQQAEERRDEREALRRDERDDKRPDYQRANLAILISATGALMYALTLLSQHWRP